MCDTLKEVIHTSPKLSTIIRKYWRDENYLNDKVRSSTQKTIIGYKLFLCSGINEPYNDFLLRRTFGDFDMEKRTELADNETKLDLDNERRRHGNNNQEKIELLYKADMEIYKY